MFGRCLNGAASPLLQACLTPPSLHGTTDDSPRIAAARLRECGQQQLCRPRRRRIGGRPKADFERGRTSPVRVQPEYVVGDLKSHSFDQPDMSHDYFSAYQRSNLAMTAFV